MQFSEHLACFHSASRCALSPVCKQIKFTPRRRGQLSIKRFASHLDQNRFIFCLLVGWKKKQAALAKTRKRARPSLALKVYYKMLFVVFVPIGPALSDKIYCIKTKCPLLVPWRTVQFIFVHLKSFRCGFVWWWRFNK